MVKQADNPAAALALDELFSEKAGHLVDHPGLGRLGRVAGTRELVAHRNYILIYDLAGDLVRVLRVGELQKPGGKRLPSRLFLHGFPLAVGEIFAPFASPIL